MDFTDELKKVHCVYTEDDENWLYPIYLNDLILPVQGFKLHISATVNNATDILHSIIAYLTENKIAFKVIKNMDTLKKLNNGQFGFSQIGKFITIYPINDEKTIEIAYKLEDLLKSFNSSKIPSDKQLKEDSVIYYRYGLFTNHSYENKLIKNDGTLVEDLRKPGNAVPEWVKDPFYEQSNNEDLDKNGLFNNNYLIINCLRQKAKGGVYKAISFKEVNENGSEKQYPQVCIVKEARYLAVVDENSVDFRHRLKWERDLLLKINSKLEKVVPKVYDFFEYENNYYLVTELIEGKSLLECIQEKMSLSDTEILRICNLLLEKLKVFHHHNIIVNDLSLDNVVLLPDGDIRIIDLEFGYHESSEISASLLGYGTPGFHPLTDENNMFVEPTNSRDLYAVGAIAFALVKKDWYLKTLKNEIIKEFWNRPNLDSIENELLREVITSCLLSPDNVEKIYSIQEKIRGL